MIGVYQPEFLNRKIKYIKNRLMKLQCLPKKSFEIYGF